MRHVVCGPGLIRFPHGSGVNNIRIRGLGKLNPVCRLPQPHQRHQLECRTLPAEIKLSARRWFRVQRPCNTLQPVASIPWMEIITECRAKNCAQTNWHAKLLLCEMSNLNYGFKRKARRASPNAHLPSGYKLPITCYVFLQLGEMPDNRCQPATLCG
jgi:hypothetical protein